MHRCINGNTHAWQRWSYVDLKDDATLRRRLASLRLEKTIGIALLSRQRLMLPYRAVTASPTSVHRSTCILTLWRSSDAPLTDVSHTAASFLRCRHCFRVLRTRSTWHSFEVAAGRLVVHVVDLGSANLPPERQKVHGGSPVVKEFDL